MNLAKGVMRSGRLPGPLREKEMHEVFKTLDAQAVAGAAAKASFEGDTATSSTAPPPDPAVEALLADVAADDPSAVQDPFERQRAFERLKRNVQKLERANAKRRTEFEELFADVTNLTVRRFQERDRLEAAEANLAKRRRDLREAKEMVKIQEREIRELHALLQEAPAKPRTPPVKRAGSHARPGSQTARSRPKAGLSSEEAKRALLHDKLSGQEESNFHGFINNENEKLFSVIDAVGELSRQLRTEPGGKAGIPFPESTEVAAPPAQRRSISPPPAVLALRKEKQKALAQGKEKEWASYSNVLKAKPPNHKLFMF